MRGCKRVSHKKAIDLVLRRVREEAVTAEERQRHRMEGRRDVYFRLLEKGRAIRVSSGKQLRMKKSDRSVWLCPSKW